MSHYEVIVIGSGPAAKSIAKQARRQERRTAIVESREFGGTCALRGCNPKKVYTNAAALVANVRHADGKLVRSDQVRTRWEDLLRFKEEFVQPVIDSSEDDLREAGIDTYAGVASFVDRQRVQIAPAGKAEAEQLTASRFVIATGSTPAPLSFPGNQRVIDSDAFMQLAQLPDRVVFVGGGYISMEFGHAAARHGCEVTIVQRDSRLLTAFDPDLVDQLTCWSRDQGMRILTETKIGRIDGEDQGPKGQGACTVHLEGKHSEIITADLVVHGAGRVPNLAALNLDRAAIRYDAGGVTVDRHLRSVSHPSVFAAGDCADNGAMNLTTAANIDAQVIGHDLFRESPERIPNYDGMAAVAFTVPPIARVGMSEQEARQRGRDVEVRQRDVSTWGSVRKSGLPCAAYKTLVDRDSGRILGAHLLGPRADEQINVFSLAIRHGLTADDLKSTPLAFPTHGYEVRRMV